MSVTTPLEKVEFNHFKNIDIENVKVYPIGLGTKKGVYFYVIGCPALQLIRSKLGLPWISFHVTLGFNINDNHTIDKGPLSLIHHMIQYSNELLSYALERCKTNNIELLAFKSFISFNSQQYLECRATAQEGLILDPNHQECLIRFADASFKLGYYESSLLAYWKLYIHTSQPKLKSHIHTKIHKLWKKGIVNIEMIENDLLKLNEEEMETYRRQRMSFVQPLETCEQINVPEPRVMVKLANVDYKLPRFFSWIVPFVLGGMSTPKCSTDIRHLKNLGISNVITLTEEEPLDPKWFQGISNHFWPVKNYYPPSIAHIDEFMKVLIGSIFSENPGSVLVHCGGGKGRAGSMIACYLATFGLAVPPEPSCAFGSHPVMNAGDAIALLRAMRPGSIETKRQENFISEYITEKWKRIGEGKQIYDAINTETDTEGEIIYTGSKSIRPLLLVLMGLPGSGKSWFSEKLAAGYANWMRVSQDDIGSKSACETMVSNYSKTLGKPHRLVIDRCNPRAEDRKLWRNIAGNPKSCAIVYFSATGETCTKRTEQRLNHPTVRPHSGANIVKSFEKQLELPSLSEGFDTIYTVSNFADANLLLKHFGVKQADEFKFIKYPRTRHLYNLGSATRDDLILDETDALAFLQTTSPKSLTIQEKVDGANVGFRMDRNGEIICQNRTHIINSASHPQFQKLGAWIYRHKDSLSTILGSNDDRILFGEWMAAKHSIHYDQLDDYFIAFDCYDIKSNSFYSVKRFHELLQNTTLITVPVIEIPAILNRDTLVGLLNDPSVFSSKTPREGLVLRIDQGDWMVDKAKMVRPDFIAGNVHWKHAKPEQNTLKLS
ncbi:hypothetical protein BC833DRAFT_522811 [Globomyces pollinis-pini]|nr:hypothetical protein BC833DRAFT_522811 [Globomyces pollinis-pini]